MSNPRNKPIQIKVTEEEHSYLKELSEDKNITLGDAFYEWRRKLLENAKARLEIQSLNKKRVVIDKKEKELQKLIETNEEWLDVKKDDDEELLDELKDL